MNNVSVALQIAREIESRGWEPVNKQRVVFQKRVGEVIIRCKFKGQSALIYTVRPCSSPQAENYRRVPYKSPSAVRDVITALEFTTKTQTQEAQAA